MRDAFQRGDASVIAAVIHAPSTLLTGPVELPMKEMTDAHVAKANPDLDADMKDAAYAQTALGLAWDSFKKSVGAMRDRGAETRAVTGQAKAQEAEAVLQAAMSGAA